MNEKLVRDKISKFSEEKQDGRKFRQISNAEQLHFLAAKLREESLEVTDAMYNGTALQLTEELADVLEVIETICLWRGIRWDSVQLTQNFKREKKGGFGTFTAMQTALLLPDETI